MYIISKVYIPLSKKFTFTSQYATGVNKLPSEKVWNLRCAQIEVGDIEKVGALRVARDR